MMQIKGHEPYYSEKGIQIYVNDSRELLPKMKMQFSAVITDPVWPNVPDHMKEKWNVDDPFQLMKQTSKFFPRLSPTTVIVMGCNSDPRFLTAIPKSLPFIRHAFTEYRVPSPTGRILKGHDCVYAFGKVPETMPGILLPGRYMEKENVIKERRHPCPRNLQLTKWIVKWYGGNGPILDPFMGSGTTLLAAKIMGLPAVGIEMKKEYADIAIDRLRKVSLLEFDYDYI